MKFANIVFPPTALVKLPSQHCSITEKEYRHNSKESLEAEQRLTTGKPTLLLQYLELEKAETAFSVFSMKPQTFECGIFHKVTQSYEMDSWDLIFRLYSETNKISNTH